MEPVRNGKVYMILGLRGKDLDPAEVTERLSLAPTKAFRRGEMFAAGGRLVPNPYGAWMKTTETSVASEELQDHCACLTEWMRPVEAQLKAYGAQPDVTVSVGFWWEPSDGPIGFTFPARELRLLSEMCNDFDFYFA